MSASAHTEPAATAASAAHPVRGLAVAENGLRLVVDDPELRRGRTEQLRFRIVDERGATVRDFDVEHTKRMHLIVARRDLTGFQHLHPEPGRRRHLDRRRSARRGRLLPRCSPTSPATDEPYTLAADLRVDGDADLRPLPAPAATAVERRRLRRAPGRRARAPGQRGRPALRDHQGRPRRSHTEPYLGAGGHLVALREGDLAFLHVHPTSTATTADVAFAATFPTAGRYRLFLQFKHEGRVQTVAFTQEVR